MFQLSSNATKCCAGDKLKKNVARFTRPYCMNPYFDPRRWLISPYMWTDITASKKGMNEWLNYFIRLTLGKNDRLGSKSPYTEALMGLFGGTLKSAIWNCAQALAVCIVFVLSEWFQKLHRIDILSISKRGKYSQRIYEFTKERPTAQWRVCSAYWTGLSTKLSKSHLPLIFLERCSG